VSKASDWVKKCAEAKAIGPADFKSPQGDQKGVFFCGVDYMSGRLKFNNDRSISAEEAIRLASWIINTFGD
jgi:hypothetical protein